VETRIHHCETIANESTRGSEMMLASRTRTLVRKAAMVASSAPVSTSTATSRRAMGASTRRIHRSFHSNLVSNRGFSTLPTDEGSGDNAEAKQQIPSASAVVQDNHNDEDESPLEEEAENVAMAFDENDNPTQSELNKNLKPSEIVEALDRHIVGQSDAKKSVAIAMRNRWRRRQLPEDLRKEVTPRNVLLVGPTGCGKTEVARRMAMINDAPFLKVEATKFTEVGYHGRDVDQIIRDLMDVAMQLAKKQHTEIFKEQAEKLAEERILDILAGPSSENASRSRESFRDMLQQGLLDDQKIEIDVPNPKQNQNELDQSNPQIVAMSDLMQRLASGGKKQSSERKKMPISDARGIIYEVELERLLENVDLKKSAVAAVEESGVVFIDEIDKICSPREGMGGRSADASAEGVQRDLLPLIEGTTINTKHGNVNTDYILFIASGAFHAVKVSDLLPELQGRLPIRVELAGLTEDDLYKILTEPVANLVRQQIELIGAEGVDLVFEDEALREIARMAALLNKTVENIGARRLHTVLERIMETISFDAAEMEDGSTVNVTKDTVTERLSSVTKKMDVSRYIL